MFDILREIESPDDINDVYNIMIYLFDVTFGCTKKDKHSILWNRE